MWFAAEQEKYLLENGGTITVEFPHLLNLIKLFQFDTIYHEHYYLSLYASKIMLVHRTGSVMLKKISNTHGGLRLYCNTFKRDSSIQQSESVEKIINEEIDFGLNKLSSYSNFISSLRDKE